MYVCINYILTVVHASVGIVWQTFALFGICILFECNIIFCCWKLHTCAHFYTPHHPRHRRHHPRRASLLLLFLLWLFLPLQPHIEHITSTWDMWMHPLWFLCVSKWRRRWCRPHHSVIPSAAICSHPLEAMCRAATLWRIAFSKHFYTLSLALAMALAVTLTLNSDPYSHIIVRIYRWTCTHLYILEHMPVKNIFHIFS